MSTRDTWRSRLGMEIEDALRMGVPFDDVVEDLEDAPMWVQFRSVPTTSPADALAATTPTASGS